MKQSVPAVGWETVSTPTKTAALPKRNLPRGSNNATVETIGGVAIVGEAIAIAEPVPAKARIALHARVQVQTREIFAGDQPNVSHALQLLPVAVRLNDLPAP